MCECVDMYEYFGLNQAKVFDRVYLLWKTAAIFIILKKSQKVFLIDQVRCRINNAIVIG